MNCFSGIAASVFKVLHYVLLSLSKNKIEIKKEAFPFQTNVIGNGHAIPLGRCGPLRVMLGWFIIITAISRFICSIFSTVFVSYRALTL